MLADATLWRNQLCRVATLGCTGFLVLAALAMLTYPGGTPADPAAHHYQFFHNPFSDLGRTKAFDGRPNRVAMALFIAAMLAGGTGLAAFFVAFAGAGHRSVAARALSRAGAALGIVAGLCFVGVGCTPWDLYLRPHMQFVFAAFRSLLVATLLDALSILGNGALRGRLLVPFVAFACVLVGYLALLTAGLSGGPTGAAVVQATGQKAIAAAAMVMVLVQSARLRRIAPRATPSNADPTPMDEPRHG